MTKKRLGIVLSSVPGYSETFFYNKINGLQNNGFEVLLFVLDHHTKNTKLSCEIIKAPNFNGSLSIKLLNILRAIFKAVFINTKQSYTLYRLDEKDGLSLKKRIKRLLLNQFLLSKKLDWLHFGFGMLAVNRENIAEAIGAKMAVSFRGFDLYLSPLKHKECYKLLFLKNVYYHVLSNDMKTILIHNEIAESMITVVNPALDLNFFQQKQKQIHSISNPVEILTIARLHWVKGLDYVLQALALLKKEQINFRYTVIGEGKDYERLVFAAHQLGIKQHVVFTGKMSATKIRDNLRKSDIYIQFSVQEGFGNAPLEAQAMGVLCVVSNAGGLSENILDGKTGWVVPKRNFKVLASTIKKVLDMPLNEKQQLRDRALKRVKNEFSINKQEQDFVQFYSQ